MIDYLGLYLIIVNILSIALFFIDKELAKRNMYRISEKTLLTITIIGGALGSIIGIYTFHHKTKKKEFIITALVSLIIWGLLIIKK